jgi:hypothetical protein
MRILVTAGAGHLGEELARVRAAAASTSSGSTADSPHTASIDRV